MAIEKFTMQGSKQSGMPRKIQLQSSDGNTFDAWRADPSGAVKGGIIVLHAIYGLTDHIGNVCEQWSDAGYAAIAPSLFDRSGRGQVFGYDPDGAAAGAKCYGGLAREDVLADIAACSAALPGAKSKIISGFCTGGTWAWIASAIMPFDAQVNFYGSHVVANRDLAPLCPTIMHYGDADHVVTVPEIGKIRTAQTGVTIHIYPGGGHAFFNPEQDRYNESAAAAAWENSLSFLDQHLKPPG